MFLQILINNIKVLGIYGVISILSILIQTPLINIAEPRGSAMITSCVTIFVSGISLALFFFAGRLVLKGTGVLVFDCLSYTAFLIILTVTLLFFPQIIYYFMFPHSLFVYFLSTKISSYSICIIMTASISLITLFVGTITKSAIVRII